MHQFIRHIFPLLSTAMDIALLSFLQSSCIIIELDEAGPPQLIWSANRNNPVRENSTLEFTQAGNLILRDVDGTHVWSTNTTGRSIVRLEVLQTGNLVLFDANNNTIWQSFDYQTDTLVFWQKLVEGQKLIASGSTRTFSEGSQYLSLTSEGLFAFIDSNPPLSYFGKKKTSNETSYVRLEVGSLSLYANNAEPKPTWEIPYLSVPSAFHYMKLGSDGHLRVYGWYAKWIEVYDLFFGLVDDCYYPLVCGQYGVCLRGQCTCPEDTENGIPYFKAVDGTQQRLGCAEITPLLCEVPQQHQLISLHDITYFNVGKNEIHTDLEACKQACLRNCSCKASFFRYGGTGSLGHCYLEFDIFSLINNEIYANSKIKWSAHIKVVASALGKSPEPRSSHPKVDAGVIALTSVLGMLFVVLLLSTIIVVLSMKKKKRKTVDKYASCFDSLDKLSGTPMIFSYGELKIATENFSRKLREGACGSVYEGTLINGNKVAVKWLDRLAAANISFLAEVETIGNVHHVNLVKLLGFCADKSHKLLVYEFMCNGSLDKWIFSGKNQVILDWQTRQKIILDIAKGLAYLHEDCTQKILHLDIKPQNILLDDKFNAKVSDFGLSKLLEKDQSKVITAMRGTPGYMAPEWFSFVITEKVDVHSFGIVVMEILCGQKNLNFTKPEECMHLLRLLEKCAEEDRLYDMIDSNSDDMKLHRDEIVKMMRLVVWCVQNDFCKRPSMSVVVKVLDGLMEIETNLDYRLLNTLSSSSVPNVCNKVGSPLLSSVLSRPR